MQPVEAYVPEEQLREVINGNAEEMSEVLSRRLPSFYRTAYRFLRNTADAEDAVQDALLSAYKHLSDFRGQSQLSTWLTVIVSNCARMHLRSRPRHLHVSIDEPIGEDQDLTLSERLADNRRTPEDECRDAQLKAELRRMASQLSPTLRRTFQLRDLDGLSIREVADVLNVPVGTIKAQSSRARAKLKRSMRRALAIPETRRRDALPQHSPEPDAARKNLRTNGSEGNVSNE
jgi:RNA polymerase sigma-70 factor (ECF subfamily)